ncbi:MAG: hypothetical protein Q4E25_10155 [Corynebacterium sp.]|nr:hypothetical protein [Corynebacterium sp.]MDO5032981.1 hypothetical protein [Corynebacterium sp.]
MTPPAGPAWAGSLMGTSIAATLSHLHGFSWLAWFFLAVATGVAVVILAGWLRHRAPAFQPATMAPWGMLAMGLLALGSAWTACTGLESLQVLSWWVGTPLAVVVCINQLRHFPGDAPSFQWALALVAPMVAATSSGQLTHHHPWMHEAGAAAFVLTFVTAVPVFVLCYRDVLRGRMSLPKQIAGTAWIPLGMVGQSTAAAQLLFTPRFAHWYGGAMLAMGIPLAAWAFVRFWSAVVSWAGYSPGWWGSTFPVGTCCLGSHMLAAALGAGWLDAVSLGLLGLLITHWGACALRFISWAWENGTHRHG